MARLMAQLAGRGWPFYWAILHRVDYPAYAVYRHVAVTPDACLLLALGEQGIDVLKGDIWWRERT